MLGPLAYRAFCSHWSVGKQLVTPSRGRDGNWEGPSGLVLGAQGTGHLIWVLWDGEFSVASEGVGDFSAILSGRTQARESSLVSGVRFVWSGHTPTGSQSCPSSQGLVSHAFFCKSSQQVSASDTNFTS